MPWHHDRLSPAQAVWVHDRLDPKLVRDMSWNLVESTVLHVRSGDRDIIVKAGGPTNHHIDRELAAHPEFTRTLVDTGHAAALLDADTDLRVMLLDYLPGRLVEGTEAEHDPDTHRQAGDLLRRLHDQDTRIDEEHDRRVNERALGWLDGRHRIDPDAARRARRILESAPTPPVRVVPTHGDWQPRNWLIDGDTVRVIDFGRFGFRPAATDLVRLAARQWRGRPALEHAFFEGYEDDPRDPDAWRLHTLREAIGTACWAHQVGDEAFERHGHRMLADALSAF